MKIHPNIKPADLNPAIDRLFSLAAPKIATLDRTWDFSRGAPVITATGKYTTRGWTEWTQGFQFGCAILAFDATGDESLLQIGRSRTLQHMATHVSHTGVHDHAFNNLSTYGNLRRLMLEGKILRNDWELNFYELAIRTSGAIQAARWSPTHDGLGYIYSFNGPHSLFIDTMRTLRILCLAHHLGHTLMSENDQRVNLFDRAITHALTTAKYLIFDGTSGHTYDLPGRTAHEALFNPTDGRFRARSTQQGYSPFSTWTRGLAWAMLGYAELLEFIRFLPPQSVSSDASATLEKTARLVCDHYLNHCSTSDGLTYWDDGAPGLSQMPDWRNKPADPFNHHEPVDSSAAVVAAQALLRMGRLFDPHYNSQYTQAGLTLSRTLLAEPYLSTDPNHQGLLLHSIYHRPNNWDHIPPGKKNPSGESSMWGDYHLLELALYLHRQISDGRELKFFL
jgi:hypothetical protein